MQTAFGDYLKAQAALTDDEINEIIALSLPRSLRRNELLLRTGEICRHKVFVISGLLRTFGISAEGNEHILQFSPENSWTLDVESYDKQIPSLMNIGAVEPSTVLLWKKTDFEHLLRSIPALKKLSEQIIARNIYYSRHRILTALSATPEEKYHDFVERFPDYLSRLPLRMIASYLGISLKTLTRIRQAQVHR